MQVCEDIGKFSVPESIIIRDRTDLIDLMLSKTADPSAYPGTRGIVLNQVNHAKISDRGSPHIQMISTESNKVSDSTESGMNLGCPFVSRAYPGTKYLVHSKL